MLKLRKVGAPRIVRKRQVVLDWPLVTSDGIVLGDRDKVIVKIDKKTLKEAWRKRADLVSYCGHDDLVCLRYCKDFQIWDSSGKVLWKRQLPTNPLLRGDRLWLVHEGQVEIIDLASGKTLEQHQCPAGCAQYLSDDGDVVFLRPSLEEAEPLRAFGLRAQQVLWERRLSAEIRERYGIECPRGLLFQPSGPGRCIADSGHHVCSIVVADGSIRWAQRLGQRVPCYRMGSVAPREESLEVGEGDGGVGRFQTS